VVYVARAYTTLGELMAKTKIGLSLISLDSEAIAAIANLLTAMIQSTPPDQLARAHARLERIATWFEEEVLDLPPLLPVDSLVTAVGHQPQDSRSREHTVEDNAVGFEFRRDIAT